MQSALEGTPGGKTHGECDRGNKGTTGWIAKSSSNNLNVVLIPLANRCDIINNFCHLRLLLSLNSLTKDCYIIHFFLGKQPYHVLYPIPSRTMAVAVRFVLADRFFSSAS